MDDIDIITDEIATIKQTKKGHKRNTKTVKKIQVRGSVEVARDRFKASKKMHKSQIRQLKRAIKAHKLEIRQAKGNYKLIKLTEKR